MFTADNTYGFTKIELGTLNAALEILIAIGIDEKNASDIINNRWQECASIGDLAALRLRGYPGYTLSSSWAEACLEMTDEGSHIYVEVYAAEIEGHNVELYSVFTDNDGVDHALRWLENTPENRAIVRRTRVDYEDVCEPPNYGSWTAQELKYA